MTHAIIEKYINEIAVNISYESVSDGISNMFMDVIYQVEHLTESDELMDAFRTPEGQAQLRSGLEELEIEVAKEIGDLVKGYVTAFTERVG